MTDNAWEKFAAEEPYWAVLTDERYKASNAPLAADVQREFFHTGEQHIERVTRVLSRHFGRRFTPQDCCLDFGSGVGRLLLPMARRCGRAIGIDVSRTMRRLCMDHAVQKRSGNVECYEAVSDPALAETGLDWVNSYIVFQHIETRKGFEILENLLSKINKNGAISIHFTVFKDRTLMNYVTNKMKYFRVDEFGVSDLQTNYPFYDSDVMMMNDYDVNKIYMLLAEYGFHSVITEHENQGGMHGLLFYSIKE